MGQTVPFTIMIDPDIQNSIEKQLNTTFYCSMTHLVREALLINKICTMEKIYG